MVRVLVSILIGTVFGLVRLALSNGVILSPRLQNSGDPCLSLISSTSGPGSETAWFNLGRCPGPARDPQREILSIYLRSGLVRYFKTEPLLTGELPFPFARVVQNQDERSRAFGRGGTHTLDMSLIGDAPRLSWVDLVYDGGSRARYLRDNSGRLRTATPGYFDQSTLNWTGRDWLLARDDGTNLRFPNSARATRLEQGALLAMYRSNGSTMLDVDRDQFGNIRSVAVEDHRVRFEFDDRHRIVALSAMSGFKLGFEYDSNGCLESQQGSGGRFRYQYDMRQPSCSLVSSSHGETSRFELEYDAQFRIRSVTAPGGATYTLSYGSIVDTGVARLRVSGTDGTDHEVFVNDEGYSILRHSSPRSEPQGAEAAGS